MTKLRIERDDAVATLTIDGAPWNIMTIEFMDALELAVSDISKDDAIRAVVITGTGDVNFSAGMDLKQLIPHLQNREAVDKILDQRIRVLAAIENMGKPWIATLFGYCLGGGLELPLACHFRLAAQDGAQIGLPELDLGTVPAWGGSARLPRCVGRDHALDMILRGLKIDGPRALEIGLVNEVVPNDQLKSRAFELAHELAAMPRLAVKSMLDVLVGFETKSLEHSIGEERAAVHANFGTKDSAEGMRAFMEKRKPKFNQSDD